MSKSFPNIEIPDAELTWTFVRSSGPGGQNVNKVNSKAVLRWQVTHSPSLPLDVRARFVQRYQRRLTSDGELILTSQRYRDQGRNVSDVREKLQAMIEAVARPPVVRRATKPSKAAKARRIESKQARSRTKKQRRAVSEE